MPLQRLFPWRWSAAKIRWASPLTCDMAGDLVIQQFKRHCEACDLFTCNLNLCLESFWNLGHLAKLFTWAHVFIYSTKKLKHPMCAGLHDATVGLSYGCPSLPRTLRLCAAVWLFMPGTVCSHTHGGSMCWCLFCQPSVERPWQIDVTYLVLSGSVQQRPCALMQNFAVIPSITSASDDYTISISHIQI